MKLNIDFNRNESRIITTVLAGVIAVIGIIAILALINWMNG